MIGGRHLPAAAVFVSLAWTCSCLPSKDDELSPIAPLESDYLHALYEFRPTLAARQGLRQYEGRLDSAAELTILRRINELKEQLGRVVAMRRKELPPDDAARARLIDYRIRSELLELEVTGRWRYDPEFYLRGPYDLFGYLRTEEYVRPAERLRSIATALYELGGVLTAMRSNLQDVPAENLRQGMETGRKLRGMLDDLEPWGMEAAGIDVALQDRFTTALTQARTDLDEGLRWLDTGVKPVADSEAALGAERFVMKVLFDEMLAISLTEMTALGERLLAQDRAAFLDEARLIAPTRRPEEVIREILAETTAEPDWAAELQRAVDAARRDTEAQNIVPVSADVRVTVKTAPAYLAQPLERFRMLLPPAQVQEAPGAAVEAGQSSKASMEGLLLFTPPSEVGYPHWNAAELELAAMENAFPGMMVQAEYRENTDGVRRVLSCHSATKGWAAYVTDRMVEQGLGATDPPLRIHQLQHRLTADCRLLASVRIHTAGMSLEEAQRLFVDQALLSSEQARLEARRALREPTYFTGLLGRVEIERLRDDYRRSQGAAFRLSEFHQEYLSLGPVPIPVARATLVP